MSSRKKPGEWPPPGFGNWNRWPNDRGTLNLLTPSVVLRAASAVRTGRVFGLGRTLQSDQVGADPDAAAASHLDFSYEFMIADYAEMGFGYPGEGTVAAVDNIKVGVHGMTNSHIDALNHAFHHGKGFNGHSIDEMVSAAEGGKLGGIENNPGVVTRGWLVDVPRMRGIDYMKPGDAVLVEELYEGAPDIQPGDAVVVRMGRSIAPVVLPGSPGSSGDPHGDWSGLHVDCILDFAAKTDVAVVATDGPGDAFPPTTDFISVPIHVLSEVYLGIPLVHGLDLEDLAAACAAEGRNDFLFVVCPLKVQGGTGSPVAPVAVM